MAAGTRGARALPASCSSVPTRCLLSAACHGKANTAVQEGAKPGQTEVGAAPTSRVWGSPGSQQLRDEGAQLRAQPAWTPVTPCPRRVVAGPWTWEAPAASRVLSPKQRPEVKVLNVPCWHDPGGGLGGTLPGRAEHPHFSSWHLLGTLRTHPLRLHPWIHSHLSRGTPKYLLIPPRPRRLGSPCHASTDPDGRAVAPGACPGCIRAPASPGPPLPSGSRPEKCSLRGLIATQRCVCR